MKELLERFKMVTCNDVTGPLEVNAKLKIDEIEEGANGTVFKQVIGSLRFLCNSRQT